MKVVSTITILGVALAALGAQASPQTPTPPVPQASQSTRQAEGPMQHGDMAMPRTPEERAKMANTMFDKIDANKDGAISRAEFVEHHEAMSMEHGGMCMGHHDMGHHEMGDHEMGHERAEHHEMPRGTARTKAFIDVDANKDGKLSREEMAKHPMSAHFDMMDADKDGYLSPKEYASHGM